MLVIGIDSHKDTLAGCLIDAAGRPLLSIAASPIDTTAPVWNVEDDLRRVETDIARLNARLPGVDITPPGPAPPPVTSPEPSAEPPKPPPRTLQEFGQRALAEFAITRDELLRRFGTLQEDPEQIEQAWRTLQIITQPKPEPVWLDHDPRDHDVPGH